ncbi:MAG: hypothetical protein RLY86_4395 [Pseudomonadota bacterium]|jgi:hypothetical protein
MMLGHLLYSKQLGLEPRWPTSARREPVRLGRRGNDRGERYERMPPPGPGARSGSPPIRTPIRTLMRNWTRAILSAWLRPPAA